MCGIRKIADAAERKDINMPEMFDWIFFAIVVPLPIFLILDHLRNR